MNRDDDDVLLGSGLFWFATLVVLFGFSFLIGLLIAGAAS